MFKTTTEPLVWLLASVVTGVAMTTHAGLGVLALLAGLAALIAVKPARSWS